MEETLRRAWTFEELEYAVDAYLEMMTLEKNKQPYSKTQIRNRALAQGLKSRSAGSFEYRMQNISTVVAALGIVPLTGYVPATNVGKNREVIEAILKSRLGVDTAVISLTSNEDLLTSKAEMLLKIGIVDKPKGAIVPAITETENQQVFLRSALVRAWVLQESRGKCEGCGSPAPFSLPSGQPFLEVHHVKPLGEDGPDIIENAVALCPNCHRRCHLSADRQKFTASLYLRIPRLVKF